MVPRMQRTSQEWLASVESFVDQLRYVLTDAGLESPPMPRVALGGPFLVTYDPSSGTVWLGFDEHDSFRVYQTYGVLLDSDEEGEELEQLLQAIVHRMVLHAVGLHLRFAYDAHTPDEWLENQVANAIAQAAGAPLFAAERAFLVPRIAAAIESLRARIEQLQSEEDLGPSYLGVSEKLQSHLLWFQADLHIDEQPDLPTVLKTLVTASGQGQRRVVESELALMETLTKGPPALRRTAAELFADEASAESLAKTLAGTRELPPDVRFSLAAALLLRGMGPDAAAYLGALATSPRTPPPVAAASALLLDDAAASGLNLPQLLSELEDAGLADALKLVKVLPTRESVAAVWPLLGHRAASVRKEAYRLLAHVLPETESWTGIEDPEPSIRIASVLALSPRPGLPRAIAALLVDDDEQVRRAALVRARVDGVLAHEVATLLMSREADSARRAAAAVVSDRSPEWADGVFGRVIARDMRPYTLAVAAARAADPWDRHLALVDQLAMDALQRHRRETVLYAAEVRGRTDWMVLFEFSENLKGVDGAEMRRRFKDALPEGWHRALYEFGDEFDPLFALRTLAVSHPEPLVRAALLLWLARAGHADRDTVATFADQDPSPTVALVAPVIRATTEDPMALTAIEKALFLRTISLFRSVPTQSLLAIGGAMGVFKHLPGETIVKQGELGDRLFVVHDGRAEVRRENLDGSYAALTTVTAGAVFGEMSLFDSEPRSATVVATDTCLTLVLDAPTFHRLGVQYPEILWEICKVLTQRLRNADGAVSATATRAA